MLKDRIFNVILVEEGKGIGMSVSNDVVKSINYSGEKVVVKL